MSKIRKPDYRFTEKKCVHELFELQAERSPNVEALVFENSSLTYRELDMKANQLAHYLHKMGVGPGVLVGICVERSFEMFVGILGILKAGGAYVPIDPNYPKDRIQFMLEDTDTSILLSQQHLLNKIPQNKCSIICLDTDWNKIEREETIQLKDHALPGDLIYTIYTSGSTGKPKGVQVEHRNVTNLIEGQMIYVDHPVNKFLYAYSFAFDGSVLLIWWTLLQGATLVIGPEGLEKDIKLLSGFIYLHQISHLLTFPSLYALLLENTQPKFLKSLESISVAGEACPGALVQKHQMILPHVKLLNQYGPTETTVGATIYTTPLFYNEAKVPIGKPIQNVKVYILNENLEKVKEGEVGEIWVGGKGVARGYLNRPKLTAERFIHDPFSKKKKNGKIYRTGDLGKFLPDGNIDFIGRADYQVKLRGYRIELGEVESAILQNPKVREAVVKIQGKKSSEQKLIAYYTLAKGEQINNNTLREFLNGFLPDYMVPSVFMPLEKMPIATSGKIDRKALPEPGNERPALEQKYVAPKTELQKWLVNLWKTSLQLDQIGIDDKFFELGGNSLQAAEFISKIQDELDETIFIVTVFDTPTIREYAQMLEKDYPQAVQKKFSIEKEISREETKLDVPVVGVPPVATNLDSNNITTEIGDQKSSVLITNHQSPITKEITKNDLKAFKKIIPTYVKLRKPRRKNPPAIFILAPPRSGTTLLRVMLAGHPQLFAANELQLLGFNTLKERKEAYAGKFSLWSEGTIRTLMELNQSDAKTAKDLMQLYEDENFTTKDFYKYLQEIIGDKILVDKSPSYALDVKALEKAEQDFDGAIFIHLLRHPYSMVKSFEKMHMDQVMFLKQHNYNAQQLGELIWTKSHQTVADFLKKIPESRQFRMKYEDLIKSPEETMKAMCETIGLSFHPDLITPYSGIEQKMTDGIYEGSKPMGDPLLLKYGKIDSKLADKWKGVAEDDFLGEPTWKLAENFGYKKIEEEEKIQDEEKIENEETVSQDAIMVEIPELKKSEISSEDQVSLNGFNGQPIEIIKEKNGVAESVELKLEDEEVEKLLAARQEALEQKIFLEKEKELQEQETFEKIEKQKSKIQSATTDIAIVGMSGRFPGAKNLDEFWKNLVEEKDVSVAFSAEELAAEGIDPEVLNDPNYINRGMPLDDVDCFDASFFGYLPKEAALMDPQHRIFLECAHAALEDAGYNSGDYDGTIGVYGGVARNTYLHNNVITHPQYFKSIEDFTKGTTQEKDFPATKVAYKLNFKGPAVNVQTACSSSGVAVHLACQTLLAGDCDMMLVGGGRIQPPVRSGHVHTDGHALSPDGYCRTFDADADGMVRGNGMAFIVLKKLEKAIEDGDSIHAVIKATAIGNDGGDKVGFTAPSVRGQAATIAKVYEKANIDPSTVSYIEAHGTGTRIGDPIEIAGLTKAFSKFTKEKSFCAIGSVKSNIGHFDAGACIAGIIKTVLSLKNERLPATLHFKKPNPQIDFERTPFFVNAELRDWEKTDTPRRAGVSSFGLGGTNAHILLEESPEDTKTKVTSSHNLLLLSAKTEEALARNAYNLGTFLERHPLTNLNDAAYTLQVGRKHFQHRLMLVCENSEEASHALINLDDRKILAESVESVDMKVSFMFPGGGAQHTNMGLGLYQSERVFRRAVDECLAILQMNHQLDLRAILYPNQTTPLSEPLENALHAITLLFAIEYATAQLWMSKGIQPKELIGHSLGEYVAACISGVFTLEEAIAMVVKRGQLFQTLPKGSMLSVPMRPEEVEKYMDETLSFAAINKPDHCVVSGSVEAIDRMKEILNAAEIHSTRLHIQVAAHSLEVEPILNEFEQFLKTINYQAPQIPIVSNVTGQWAKPEEIASADYWVKHLRQTVRFSEGIELLLKEEDRVLLEVGPGQTLSTFARQHPAKRNDQVVLASLRHPKEKTADLAFVLKTMGQLWLQGIKLEWDVNTLPIKPQRISLPTYSFEKQKHWIAPKQPEQKIVSQIFTDVKAEIPEAALQMSLTENIMSKQTQYNRPKIERRDLVMRDLKEVFHQLSGIEPNQMNEQATFLELGFDSLFLTQAVGKIKKQMKIELSFRQLFEEAPTFNELAELAEGQLSPNAYKDELAQLNTAPTQPEPQPQKQNGSSHTASQIQSTPQQVSPNYQAPTPVPPIPLTPEQANSMQGIIQQQIQLMQQQLAMLSGQGQLPPQNPSEKKKTVTNNLAAENKPAIVIEIPNNKFSKNKIVQENGKSSTNGTKQLAQGDGAKHGPWKPVQKKSTSGITEQQQQYLDDLIRRYTTKTKGSQLLTQAQRKHLADPRSITGFNKLWKDMIYQIAVERSKGSKIWDVDGNEYIDYRMAFGISLFGHTPDFIQAALREQLEKGIELGVLTPLAKQVADLLCELSGMERVTLVNTGSEALSAAVRAARTVTMKDRIAIFEGDYHGIADEMLARGVERNGKSISLPVSPGIPKFLVENVLVLKYDDPNVLQKIKDNADELAAILIEPVQPNNPTQQPRELFHAIKKLTVENDIAYIFDEMITGFRTGIRGAQSWYGIEADIVAYGKIISGGLPMAAVAGRAKYLDVFDGGKWQFGDASVPEVGVTFFGGTFVRHPMSMASSIAALSEIKRRGQKMYDELNETTARFAERVKELFIATKVPMKVHSTASIIAFKPTNNNPLSKLFFYYLKLKGVHIAEKAALVSTAHTQADLDFTYKAIEETIREMQTAGFFQISVADADNQNEIVYPPSLAKPAALVASGALLNGNGKKKTVPLTEGQQEVWIEQRLGNAAAAAYNLSSDFLFEGNLNIDALRLAIRQLIHRHESLRTFFNENETTQTILPTLDVATPLIDISDLTLEMQQVKLQKLRFSESEIPLDLFNGPLCRFKIIKLKNDVHRLFMTVHHAIADGWSCGILAHDLAAFYTANCKGIAADLPKAKQISEYAIAQSEFVKSVEGKKTEAFWIKQFENDIPVLEFPTDRSRPPLKTYNCDMEKIVFDEELYQGLKKTAAKKGTTFFFMMYTAFHTFMHRLSGQDDMVLGLVAAGQTIAGNQNLVTHGVSLLPVRMQLDPTAPFSDHLKNARGKVLDAFENQNYTLGSLVKKLKLPRDLSRQPIISILFNMDAEGDGLHFGNLNASVEPIQRNYETFDIFINVKPTKKDCKFELIFNTDLFFKETIQRRLKEFETMLKGIVDNPDEKIALLPVLPNFEKQKLLGDWNNTKVDFPKEKCLHTLIEEQVLRTPHKIAVECIVKKLTYKNLNEEANQLAHFLIKKGVQVGDFVGLFADRSSDLVTILLAIMKVGGVYVPLDPSNPKDRLKIIIDDAEAGIIISHKAMQNQLPTTNAEIIFIDELENNLSQSPRENPNRNISSKELVYVIYTSGSSGNPKGVVIPHYAVVDHHLAMIDRIDISKDEALLSVATVSFDPSVQDFFMPLMVGAKVIIAEQAAVKDGFLLNKRLEETKATLLQATPATWRMLVIAGWKGHRNFTALTGGEGLTSELANKLLERSKEVWNIYGPTETTIWSTAKKIEKNRTYQANETAYEPVGRPLNNVQLYLLDEYMQPVPIGAAGEVYVGGVGVAPGGYFKRDELTVEKFVNNPFSLGEKIYRTGDMARYLSNGDLEYLRRADSQVKIRGFRIELGEIESAISQLDGVNENTVMVREDQKDNKVLAAYLVMKKGKQLDTAVFKRLLKQKLPDYMVPTAFVEIEEFPLTATLKIDRKKLPAPDLNRNELETGFVAPRTEMEKILAGIWTETLGVKDIGVNDNFFELGGHSLVAVGMMARIEKATGKSVPLSALLENSTIKTLAHLLNDEEKVATSWKSLIPVKSTGTKMPIYLVHGAGLHVMMFQTLAEHMSKEQPIFALQARGLNGDDTPLDRMEDIAAHYVSELLEHNPDGPYAVAGYSFGGLIAFEMAKQLKAMGKEIAMLGMFDTIVQPYITKAMETRKFTERMTDKFKKATWDITNFLKDPVPNYKYRSFTLRKRIDRWKYAKAQKNQPEGANPEKDILGKVDAANGRAYENYKITPYDGTIHLFRVKEKRFYLKDFEYLGWQPYAKGIIIKDVPGDHIFLFDPPNGPEFAAILQNTLDGISKGNGGMKIFKLRSA